MANLISLSSISLFARKAIVFFFLALNSFSASSQNLVPNPSFEIYDTCPDWYSQIERAKAWRSIVGTPDFLNKCANYPASIPNNILGYQDAVNVNDRGYAAIGISFPIFTTVTFREILGIQLAETLIIGTKYFFSFNYSCTYAPNRSIGCIANKLGMKLLTVVPADTIGIANEIINNKAILYSDSLASDTSNWSTFEGTFVADSAYTFLAIGNFFSRDSIVYFCYGSNAIYGYYYIDNICLSSTNDCFSEVDPNCNDKLYIFPNPTTGPFYINDSCKQKKGGDVLIYNTIGQLVFKETIEFINNPIDLSFLARGIYFLKFKNSSLKIILI